VSAMHGLGTIRSGKDRRRYANSSLGSALDGTRTREKSRRRETAKVTCEGSMDPRARSRGTQSEGAKRHHTDSDAE
jgi:hypothetical protein